MKTFPIQHTQHALQPRALLIDHTPADLELLAAVLRKDGWHVDALSKGDDALLMLGGADYDLISMEAGLPDVESFGLLRSCRDRQPYTEVIMLGAQDYDLAVEAVKRGAFQYVPKPIDAAKFLVKAKEALASRDEAVSMDLAQTAQFTIAEHPLLGCTIVKQLSKSSLGETCLCEKEGEKLIMRRIAIPEEVGDRMGHLDAFMKVIDALSKISHRHVARVLEYGFPEGMDKPVILIEYVKGTDLGTIMAAPPLPLTLRMELFRQMAAGLSFAHSCGVVHRNLKPSNVLVAEDATIKLSDFGISLLRDSAGTGTVSLRGLPFYSAPECFVPNAFPHAPADVFALGALGYELLTGRKAFAGTSMAETVKLVSIAKPVAPLSLDPSLSPVLQNLLAAMLNKKPEARPQTDEVSSALNILARSPELLASIESHYDTPENRDAWSA